MKKPSKKSQSPSDELHKTLGIPKYQKQALDDGFNKQPPAKQAKPNAKK